MIDDLQKKLEVNENTLKAFFTVLSEKDVSIEQLQKKLIEIAVIYKEALAQAEPNSNEAPEIVKLKTEVRAALEAGALDRADELLAQVEKLQDAALVAKQKERAETSAQRGRVAMAGLRYRDAERHYTEATRQAPKGRTDSADTEQPQAGEPPKSAAKDEAKATVTVPTKNKSTALPSQAHAAEKRKASTPRRDAGPKQYVGQRAPAKYQQPVYGGQRPESYDINPTRGYGQGTYGPAPYSDKGN